MVLIVSVPDGDKQEIEDWEEMASKAGIQLIVTKFPIQNHIQKHEFVFLSIPDIDEDEKKRIEGVLKKAGVKTVIITSQNCDLVNI